MLQKKKKRKKKYLKPYVHPPSAATSRRHANRRRMFFHFSVAWVNFWIQLGFNLRSFQIGPIFDANFEILPRRGPELHRDLSRK